MEWMKDGIYAKLNLDCPWNGDYSTVQESMSHWDFIKNQ